MVEMACATSAASADCLGHRLNPTGLNGTDSMGRTKSRPLCGTVTAVFEPAWTRCNRGQSGWLLDVATPLFGSQPTHPVWSCRERGRYETRISRQVISNAIPRVIFSSTVDRTGRVMLGQCSGLTRLADYEAAGPCRSAGNWLATWLMDTN